MSTKKNILWMALYEIFVYICPLITTPYVARVLGTYGTGIYSYSYSIVSYLIVFTQLGVKLYGRREIAASITASEREDTFWGIWLVETIMFIASSVLYFPICFSFEGDMRIPMLMQYMALVGTWLDISWLYFGVEDFVLAISRNIIVKVISMLAVFVFVRQKQDINTYVFIMAFSNLISVIVMWGGIRKYIKRIIFNKTAIKRHFPQMLKMFVPVLSTQLFSMTDKIFLGAMTTVDDVGIYENAFKISRVPVALITTIGTVSLPKMTKLNAEGKNNQFSQYFNKSLSATVFIGSGCAFGLIGISEKLIPIYLGSDFILATPVLQILSIVLLAIAWGNAFRTQFILPKKMDGLYLRSVLYAAIINVILNCFMIPNFSVYGAAMASVISEMVVCVYQSIKIRSYFDFKLLLKQNAKYFYSGLIMMLYLLYMSKVLIENTIINLLFMVATGGILYSGICCFFEYITKDYLVLKEAQNIMKKLRRVR